MPTKFLFPSEVMTMDSEEQEEENTVDGEPVTSETTDDESSGIGGILLLAFLALIAGIVGGNQ